MSVVGRKMRRQKMSLDRVYVRGLPQSCGSFFLDSGAHSLYTLHVIWENHKNEYNWYKSKEFAKYVDGYAKFLLKYKDGIDYYANVDVIFHPEMTWKVQCRLEDHYGLKPVPVIHYNTDLKWIDRYIERGHTLLGIGGVGQEASPVNYVRWADKLYDHLCNNGDRLPCVATHGFAMSSYKLMIRYPWWSVDSSSWAKAAGNGLIFVPHKRDGKFTFEVKPYLIGISHRSTAKKNKGQHYDTITKTEQKIVREWLEYIKMPFGSTDKEGNVVEYGVYSQYQARAAANLLFFDKLCQWLPEWPWPFSLTRRKGFFA